MVDSSSQKMNMRRLSKQGHRRIGNRIVRDGHLTSPHFLARAGSLSVNGLFANLDMSSCKKPRSC